MEVVPVDPVGNRRTGDQFSAFYGTAFGSVYRYLLRAVVGDHALAEDLTQETFAVAGVTR
jgi:DNA-directed RNA polymerase specialized sigma24 family protein